MCDISIGTSNSFQDCSSCGAKVDIEIQLDSCGLETTRGIVNVNDGLISLDGGPCTSISLTIKVAA